MVTVLGESDADKKLEDIELCREVVKEIMNLNPTQEQLLLIVRFIAYELEDHEQMVELVQATKEYLAGSEALMIPDGES